MSGRRLGALLHPGERVDGFEVEAFVARGGMAVVYRARDVALGRSVALKVMAPELAESDKFRQRFMRESELAASLDHANIIPIYAAGETDDLLYLVMRFVQGDDLGTLIRQRGPLAPNETLPLFTQVASALDAAHARQLVHRDVKPGNILLVEGPELAHRHVYLSDFGLTKRLSSFTGVTTAGHFLGTIAYVAPEQVANRPLDHRSDIYSLGCVMYEAFAGEPPFLREDDAALLWSHMTQDPVPLSDHRSDLPPAVDAVVAKAMAKEPDQRQQSCRELMSDLRSAFRSGSRGAAPRQTGAATGALPSPPAPHPGTGTGTGQTAPDLGGSGGVRPASGPAPDSDSRPASAAQLGDRVQHRPNASGGPTARHRAGKGVRRRARARSRRGVLLATLALVVVVLGVGGFLLIGPDRWEHYSGAQSEAAVALDHPASWRQSEHDNSFVLFSPLDVTPVFTPDGDWSAVPSDTTDLVGAYVSSTGGLQLKNTESLTSQLQEGDLFRGIVFASVEEATLPAGAPAGAEAVVGTLHPRTGPTPVLFYEFVLVPATDGGSDHQVLLFCRQGDQQLYAEVFDRVVTSLRPV